jgi:hypothetical protein
VHLVLTRGYHGYHSEILWYNSHLEGVEGVDSLLGGVWGWNPIARSTMADCDSYPLYEFTALSHGEPTHNVFCSGVTNLADGRILIPGGSEAGETGVARSVVFDPDSRNFSSTSDMAERRWYPTATALPNGGVVVTSGSTYNLEWFFGGRSSPTSGDGLPTPLQPLGSTIAGVWDPGIRSTTAPDYLWPAKRSDYGAAFNNSAGEWTIFGGLDSTGLVTQPKNDTWFIYRNADNDAGPRYRALQRAAGGFPPSARFRHTLVTAPDGTQIMYGGRDYFQAKADLWQLAPDSLDWIWNPLSQSGTTPGARQGHTAVWDAENNCMLVYGGTTVSSFTDVTPADTALFKLTLGASPTWSRIVPDPDSATGQRPRPRFGHGMVIDETERYVANTGAPNLNYHRRALMFGGQVPPDTSLSHNLTNDLWVLWIPESTSTANYRWQKTSPGGTPPSGRRRFSMYDDVINDRLVIVGGDVGDSATASVESIQLDHLTSSNDHSWSVLPSYPLGSVTGQASAYGGLNWSFRQETFNRLAATWDTTGSRKRQDWYPFGFVAPQTDSIRVFYAGPDTQSYYLNLTASPAYWRPFPAASTPDFRSGSAVMYRPGKVMRSGSRDTDGQGGPARGMTAIIDLQASPSAWTELAGADTMSTGRVNANLVLLPNGKVLVNGGTNVLGNAENTSPVFRPQMWSPDDSSWTTMSGLDTLAADYNTIRGYHSNAILLPDARVLTISGNPTEDEVNGPAEQDAHKATIFCPPYLFDSGGSLRARPLFSPPESVSYGGTFNVCMDVNFPAAMPFLQSICLIKAPASTHGFNADQRYVPLSFQYSCSRHTVVVDEPNNSSVAPPGDYMLFVIKSDGTPSIASWLRVGPNEDPDWGDFCFACEGGGAMFSSGGGSDDSGVRSSGRMAPASATTVALTSPPTSENALLVEAAGERLYGLKHSPVNGSGAVIRIGQMPGGSTTLRGASLSVVDHPVGTEVHAVGDRVVIGSSSPAQAISSRSGFAGDLSGRDAGSVPWTSSNGDTLTIDLNPALANSHTLLVTARRGSRDLFAAGGAPDIVVLGPGSAGGDSVLARVEPRIGFDEMAIPNLPGRVRITAGVGTQVQRIAELSRTDSTVAGTLLGFLGAELNGSAVQSFGGDPRTSAPVSVAAEDTVALRWNSPALPAAGVEHSYFLRIQSTSASTDSLAQASSAGRAVQPVYVFALSSARPNPFMGETTIDFSLAHPGLASLRLYNVAGRLIRTLVKGPQLAGPSSVVWDGRDDRGARVGGGVYFARLESGTKHSNRKMIFLGR